MASSLARREEFLVNRFEVILVLFGFDHEAMSLSQLDLQRCVFSVLPDGQTSFRPQMSGKKKKKVPSQRQREAFSAPEQGNPVT